MRTIIILILLALLLILAGWITLGRSPERTSINIETDEIRRDTENAVQAVEDTIQSGTRAITGEDAEGNAATPSWEIQSEIERPQAPAETPDTRPAVTP
jgi:hypothetical protein